MSQIYKGFNLKCANSKKIILLVKTTGKIQQCDREGQISRGGSHNSAKEGKIRIDHWAC